MAYKNREDALAAQRKWYLANRESEIAKATKRNERNRAIARAYIKEIKESNPCTDCGQYYSYYVMDFDHLSDKFKGVNQMVIARHSLIEIKAEIAKCELVCANCHRIRTHNRSNGD